MPEERKPFSIGTINDVFRDQGYTCNKCGKSLMYGFEAHHKNGNNADNSKENCELLCGSCHDAEAWKTIQAQKQATITQVDALIEKAVKGEVAGAVLDKALDAIKLKLSLQGQVSNLGLLEAPADIRLESYTAVMEAKLQAHLEGFKEGLSIPWEPRKTVMEKSKRG